MTDKQIIIDAQGCHKCSYTTMCPHAIELVDTKLKLQKEVNKYKQALDEIEDIADDYNRVEKTSQYYRDGFDEIQDIINKAKKENKCILKSKE